MKRSQVSITTKPMLPSSRPRWLLATCLAVLVLPLAPAQALPGVLPGGQVAGEGNGDGTGPGHVVQPGIRAQVANEGRAANVTVRLLDRANNTEIASRSFEVQAGEQGTVHVPAPPARYVVEATFERLGDGPLEDREEGRAEQVAITRGCPGAWLAAFDLIYGELHPSERGCLVAPAGMAGLLEAAWLAANRSGQVERVTIPPPSAGDRGEYRVWYRTGSPRWQEAAPLVFHWRGNAEQVDPWGRTIEGPRLEYAWGRAPEDEDAWMLGDLHDPMFEAEPLRSLRYAPGEPAPYAASGLAGLTLGGSGGAGGLLGSSYEEVTLNVVYDTRVRGTACLFHPYLVELTLPPGSPAATDAVCLPGLWGQPPTLHVGQATTHRGYPAVPIYMLDTSSGRTLAGVVWLTEALAYPLDVELFYQVGDRPYRHEAYRLAGLDRGDHPLEPGPSEQAVPQLDLAPIDPLDGPALEDQMDRVPFPLAEASQAAQRDPTLDNLQAMLQDDRAVLAGASLAVERRAGPPGADDLVWYLHFTVPQEPPVGVECRRPAATASDQRATLPVTTCEEVEDAPHWVGPVDGLYPIGRSGLPGRGASFDLAIDRWDTVNPPGHRENVTRAVYRASGEASFEDRPSLLVGTSLPERTGQGPSVSTADRAEAGAVVLDLATGRTLIELLTTAEQSDLVTRIQPLAEGDGPRADAAAWRWTELPGLDPAVAGAAAIGLLAALWLVITEVGTHLLARGLGPAVRMFSRIERDELLEEETRETLLEILSEEPGLHLRELARRVGGYGRTAYHLERLEDAGYVYSRRDGLYRRFYRAGEQEAPPSSASTRERVLAIVAREPGIHPAEVARRLDCTPQAVSYHVKALVDASRLSADETGQRKRLFPVDG